MEAKEKAIVEAWGKYHNESIDSDGWSKERPQYKKDSGWYDAFPVDIKTTNYGVVIYRPKSLAGIETNNGWIRIDSDKDNPIEGGCYWCLCNNEVKIVSYTCELNIWLSSGVTHYQPIIKPLKPIY